MPQGRLLPTCSTISIPRFSSFSRIRAQFHSPRGLSQSKIFSGFTHIQHWIVEFVGRALHLVKHNFLDNCRVRTPSSPYFRLDLAPPLADRFISGFPIDYGPVLLRRPFGFPSRWTPCPPKYDKQWLQLRLGCIRLSLSCPFRRLHTFCFLRPARNYPRLWIWRPSFERQRDLNPPEQRAAQHAL